MKDIRGRPRAPKSESRLDAGRAEERITNGMSVSFRSPSLRNKSTVPVVLTIAGSDNSGGAGIQADLKTFTTLGVYGTSAITCVVAENPLRVRAVHPVPARVLRQQIELIFEVFPVAAVKTGMLYSEGLIDAVAEVWESLPVRKRPWLVVDPVMVATSGALLLSGKGIAAMKDRLIPLADLVTPNLDEAEVLLGRKIKDEEGAAMAARDALAGWGVPFLVKGGHLGLAKASDFMATPSGMTIVRAARVRGVKTHGTGCTYSASIAAGLAKGNSLEDALKLGKKFITRAIGEHLRLGRCQALNHLPYSTG